MDKNTFRVTIPISLATYLKLIPTSTRKRFIAEAVREKLEEFKASKNQRGSRGSFKTGFRND